MSDSAGNRKKPISHLENTMVILKHLKTTCILAGATTVLLATGCHSSQPTTSASASSHLQTAKTAQAQPQVARSTPPEGQPEWTYQAPPPPAYSTVPVAVVAAPAPAAAPSQVAVIAPAPTPAPQPQAVVTAPAPTPAPQAEVAIVKAAPQPAPQVAAPAPTAPVAQAAAPAPRYLDENNAQESDAEITETERLMHTQEVSGARNEATLYPDQFDGPGLTSLGTRALDLMLQDSHSCNPLVLYLEIPDDSLAEDRRMAIGRYLEDRGGLKPEQIEFHYGTNPGNYHAADTQLGYYLVKTDTAADNASPSGASSAGH